MADGHQAVVDRIASLLRERADIPAELQPVVQVLCDAWKSGQPEDVLLATSKAALWAYLERKHGTTITVADSEDRSVRAALCLAEPPGITDPQDLEEWARAMLDPA